MNINHGLRRAVLFGSFPALALACGGCAGSRVSAPVELPAGAIVTKDYKQIYLTGSHLPVRVPTSPTARMDPTISPVVILTGDDARRAGIPIH